MNNKKIEILFLFYLFYYYHYYLLLTLILTLRSITTKMSLLSWIPLEKLNMWLSSNPNACSLLEQIMEEKEKIESFFFFLLFNHNIILIQNVFTKLDPP